MLINVALI